MTGSVTYSGTGVSGTTFSYSTPGTYTVTGTFAYHEKGFSALSGTATDTIDITVQARTYTVTLNTNGGTINSGNVTSYTYGTGATLPTSVSKDYYDFGGWYDNSSCTGIAVTSISKSDTGNKEYWAKWTPKTYTVTLNTNSGTIKSGNVTSYTYGVGATLPTDITRSGYNFDGWYDNSSFTGSAVTTISTTASGNKEYWAKWSAAGSCGLELNKSGLQTLNIGDSFEVTITPNTFHSDSGKITASSSNSSAVSVSAVSNNKFTVTALNATTGNVTITVSCDETNGGSATFTVKVNAPTIKVSDQSGKKVGDTYTITPTLTNPSTTGSGWTVVYTPANSSILSISGNSITRNKTGSCLVTASFRYNGVEKASCQFQNTDSAPTVSFAEDAVAIDVDETATQAASYGNIGDAATGKIAYSGTNEYIRVNASTGAVTGLKPTSAPQTVTATYTVTCNGQTTTVTDTYAVTVNTPVVTFTAQEVAKGDSVTMSDYFEVTPALMGTTYAFDGDVDSSITINSANGKVTVAADSTVADGTTVTVVATVRNSDGTVITATGNSATVTIRDRAMHIYNGDGKTEIADNTTIYKTVGATTDLGGTTNFHGTVTYKSDNESVATVSDEGVLTAVAKGTAKITVTATKSGVAGVSAKSFIFKKVLAATGADTGITMTRTFTVSVAAADTYKYIYFTNGAGWSTVRAYLYGDGTNAEWPGQTMVQIGTNEQSQKVYAIRYPAEKKYTHIIISGTDSKRVKNSSDGSIKLSDLGSNNAIWCNNENKATLNTDYGYYTCKIAIPQVTVANEEVDLGATDATMTATCLTAASVGKLTWSPAKASDATYAYVSSADTGSTLTNTIVTKGVGTEKITVKAYTVAPDKWNLLYDDSNAFEYLGTETTATVTVTADQKALTYLAEYTQDGTTFNPATTQGTFTVNDGDYTSGDKVDYGTAMSLAAEAKDGYGVLGLYKRTGAGTDEDPYVYTALTGTTKTYGTTGTTDDGEDYTKAEVKLTESGSITLDDNYTVVARFGKLYMTSAFKSYIWDKTANKAVLKASAPAKLNNATYDGIIHYYAAGTDVTYTYTQLSSSDLIKEVRVDNDVTTYTDGNPLEEHFHFADGSTTGYAGFAVTNTENSAYTYNPDAKTITLHMGQDFKNMTIVLGDKSKITFAGDDAAGYVVTGLATDGFYSPNAEVSFTVKATASTDCTYTITSVTSDNAAITVSDPAGGVYTVSGKMPGTDVVITVNYDATANFVVSSNCITDLNVNDAVNYPRPDLTSKWTDKTSGDVYVADISITYQDETTDTTLKGGTTTSNKVPKTSATKSVPVGSTVTVSYAATKFGENYSFLGWYESAVSATTPDYSKKVSGDVTFTYTVKANKKLWAVGTRNIFIGGTFYDNNGTVEYSNTSGKTTWSGNRLVMEYDPSIKAYYYVFNSVSTGKEYQFRCYDTQNSTGTNAATSNLYAWNQKTNANDYTDTWTGDPLLNVGRKYYSGNSGSHGYFTLTSSQVASGYSAPVTVWFYANDGGMNANSTYTWSNAYVSYGRGIDATNAAAIIAADTAGTTVPKAVFNKPTATVEGSKIKYYNASDALTSTATKLTAGDESYYRIQVQEKDGTITVHANPNDANLELEAFVVYNLKTKTSKGITTFTTSDEPDENGSYTYSADIQVKADTNVYIAPVYKFTKTYMSANNMDSHVVYVSTEGIDKSTWGGLVSMYSWGSIGALDSGGWPGQLMIPSDDGTSFYGTLSYTHGGLAGVGFNNYYYNNLFSNKFTDGTYTSANHQYQTYDYREPLSIIENLEYSKEHSDVPIYTDEDMDLNFSLKTGDATAHTGTYSQAKNFEYLTNRSGKRVDLNGKVLENNPTSSYKIVCKTADYSKTNKSYPFLESYNNSHSIDWYLFDASGNPLNYAGTNEQIVYLSASYMDVKTSSMYSVIADVLESNSYPVSGRSVEISYEAQISNGNTGVSRSDFTSGQWYYDSVNSDVTVNVRVGTLIDGVYTASDSNIGASGTATVSVAADAAPFTVTDAKDAATLYKKYASNKKVTLSVSSANNFVGWYRQVNGEWDKEPVSTDKDFTPSFNADITYYALYKPVASYVYIYKDRSNIEHQYSVEVKLTDDEIKGYSGNDNNPGVPQYIFSSGETDKITANAPNIKLYKQNIDWTQAGGATFKPDGKTVQITGKIKPTQYTVTYHYGEEQHSDNVTYGSFLRFAGDGDDTTGGVEATISNEAIKAAAPSGQRFLYWAEGSVEGRPITKYASYGMQVLKDIEIYAVYGTSYADSKWFPTIEEAYVTSTLDGASDDPIVNYAADFIASFTDYEGNTPEKYGIIVAAVKGYAGDEFSDTVTVKGSNNVKAYAKALAEADRTDIKASGKITNGDMVTVFSRTSNFELSSKNRADIVLSYSSEYAQCPIVAYAYVIVNGEAQLSDPVYTDVATSTSN